MAARKGQSGWFCEIPTPLKEEFKRLYPGRSAMRKLTIAAIKWTLKEHPKLLGAKRVDG